MAKKLKLTQVRSVIGSQRKKHRCVMDSLGFRRNYTTLYKNDTPQIRGMIVKVRHLVTCEEIDEKDIPASRETKAGFTVIGSAPAKLSAEAAPTAEDEEGPGGDS